MQILTNQKHEDEGNMAVEEEGAKEGEPGEDGVIDTGYNSHTAAGA